jgi:hypothetical protein
LRFTDIYRRVRGGQLTLDLATGTHLRGALQMKDFELVDEAAFAAAMKGAGAQNPVPSGAPAEFSRMRGSFHQTGGRLIVDDAVIWGPALGATLEGTIDYAADRLNLHGTFVPIYAVNNLFSQLPIIGALIGGGKDEGLLGITFQVAGPIRSPTLRVNPFSAVMPGVFRKLFEFRDDEPRESANGASTTGTPAPALPAPRP